MKSIFFRLLCAGLLVFGTSAYAAPVFKNGDSITLTIDSGGTTYDFSGGGSAAVDNAGGGAVEFTICFFASGGSCSSGLQIDVDLHDNIIDFILTGSAGAGGQFL